MNGAYGMGAYRHGLGFPRAAFSRCRAGPTLLVQAGFFLRRPDRRTEPMGTRDPLSLSRAGGRTLRRWWALVLSSIALPLALLTTTPAPAKDRQDDRKASARIRNDGSCWPSPPGTNPRRCPPNDPKYDDRWDTASNIPADVDRKKMHPKEVELGAIGFSLDKAWQHTIGRDDVTIAVLDSGILWDNRELVRKLYLNPGELPFPELPRF